MVISFLRHLVPFRKYRDWPSLVITLLVEISLYFEYSPPTFLSVLSNNNSIVAVLTGLRNEDPLNMTSDIDSPLRYFAEDSPKTQRTASITLDFPQPFGPTIPTIVDGRDKVVGSTKVLKPESFILLNRIKKLKKYH